MALRKLHQRRQWVTCCEVRKTTLFPQKCFERPSVVLSQRQQQTAP